MLLLRGRPAQAAGLRDREKRSVHRGEAGEGEVGEEAAQPHLIGSQSPWAVLFPGPVGDEPGRKKGGVGPLEGEPGEAPPGRSGGALGLVGWLGAAAAAGWAAEE